MEVAAVAPSTGSRAIVEAVVQGLTAELDVVAGSLCDAIHANVGAIERDMRPSTLESTRSNLGMIATMLTEGTKPSVATPTPEALAYARRFVRRGLDFEVLQRAYRTAQAALSRRWLRQLEDQACKPDELTATFGFLSDWLFAWMDALEGRLAEYYTLEREQWMRGTSAIRAQQVRSVLEGGPVDSQQTSMKLRYELDRRHVAFIIWTSDAGPDGGDATAVFGGMERVAEEVAKLLGAIDHLAVPLGPQLACWAGFRAAPIEDVPRRLTLAVPFGLKVATGRPGEGVEGFRRSHKEALRTRRVLDLDGAEPGRWGRYDDVSLDALLTEDTTEAQRFARRELGRLGDESAAARRMRATLAAFLDANCSFRHAAQRLGVHENTVSYRVRRSEDLLGHTVKERQLELRTALRLMQLVA